MHSQNTAARSQHRHWHFWHDGGLLGGAPPGLMHDAPVPGSNLRYVLHFIPPAGPFACATRYVLGPFSRRAFDVALLRCVRFVRADNYMDPPRLRFEGLLYFQA